MKCRGDHINSTATVAQVKLDELGDVWTLYAVDTYAVYVTAIASA